MRKLLIGSSTLVALALVAPFITGHISERQLTNLIATAPAPAGVKLRLESYQRGWFSSTGNVKVLLNADSAQPITLQAPFTVHHGPILIGKDFGIKIATAGITSTLALEHPDSPVKPVIIDEQAIVILKSTLSLLGNLHTKLSTTAINYQQADGTVSWNGLQGTLDYKPATKSLQSNLEISPFSFASTNTPALKVGLSGMSISSHLQQADNGLWLGDVHVAIATLTHQQATKPSISLEGLAFTSHLQTVGDDSEPTASYKASAVVNKVLVNHESYGPLDMEYSIDQLDQQGLVKLNSDIHALLLSNNENVASSYARLLQTTAMLLRHGLKIDVNNFAFKAPQGDFNLQAKLSLPPIADLLSLLGNAQQLIKQIDLTINLQASTALAKQLLQHFTLRNIQQVAQLTDKATPEEKTTINHLVEKDSADKLQAWLNEGYVKLDNDNYSTTFMFKEGQPYLNDKRLDAPAAPVAAVAK